MNLAVSFNELTDNHYLKHAPDRYRAHFARAAESVYPRPKLAKTLQEKFFIPLAHKFDLNKYCQSAAELTLQNYLHRHPLGKNFEIDKRLAGEKDVDAFCKVGGTRVAIEVKCAQEQASSPETFQVRTAGRLPDFPEPLNKLQNLFRDSKSGHKLEIGKNKDNTLKDFLLSANSKFSSDSNVDDLNILLIACGGEASLQHWWHYLYGYNELFTSSPFHPAQTFRLVDVVLLTNLNYFHLEAPQCHDWSMENVFVLPFVNPHGRSSLVSESISQGLTLFDHHMKRFIRFSPKWNPGDVDVRDADVLENVKVLHYIAEQLTEFEKNRHFPVRHTKTH